MEYDIYEYTNRNIPYSWNVFFLSKMKIIKTISDVVKKDVDKGNEILPPINYLWNAFVHTSYDNVKVIILGQDPYPKPGDAVGLSFSSRNGVPKSLENIYKVLEKTVDGFIIPESGDLTDWAVQGVLLINSAFTIIANQKNSHSRPWKQFTSALVEFLSDNKKNLVFILWGKESQAYKKIIDKRKHLVLETSHPSPLSFYNGFSDSNHFVQTNTYLTNNSITPINWKLPSFDN